MIDRQLRNFERGIVSRANARVLVSCGAAEYGDSIVEAVAEFDRQEMEGRIPGPERAAVERHMVAMEG